MQCLVFHGQNTADGVAATQAVLGLQSLGSTALCALYTGNVGCLTK